MDGNFATVSPRDFLALKDLNPFTSVSKVQEASSILRVGFALSKWPDLHRAYLVTVREYLFFAVLSWGALKTVSNVFKEELSI